MEKEIVRDRFVFDFELPNAANGSIIDYNQSPIENVETKCKANSLE